MFEDGYLELLQEVKMVENPFLKLLHVAVGNEEVLAFSEHDWQYCYNQAEKQSLLAFLFPVVQKYLKKDTKSSTILYNEWFAHVVITDDRNTILNRKANELSNLFDSWGLRSCVLKGQGVSTLYPNPQLRQPGDIDIWVEGGHETIINCLKENQYKIRNIDYVHSGVKFFDDVEVEVHYRPSWLCYPVSNKKLQSFFVENAAEQYKNYDKELGFAYPTISFNLVYSLIHINRHIFEEGIGLRQLCDYYYILKHSTKEERDKALAVMIDLGLRKFVGAIMYIEYVVLGIDKKMMLCLPNEEEGRFLLEEIMRGGNFGHYDERNRFYSANDRFRRGLFTLRRNLRYLRHYPSEVLWKPLWQIWHWCWRKWKGYL